MTATAKTEGDMTGRGGFTLASLLLAAWSTSSIAQSVPACGAEGHRVLARRWDAVLGVGWELRQDCAHPEWPARSVALAADARPAGDFGVVRGSDARARAQIVPPLLVHAGDSVRVWSQCEKVRIEMTGIAEVSARNGERVVVRITRQSEENGLTVERVEGIVRGAGNVEMER